MNGQVVIFKGETLIHHEIATETIERLLQFAKKINMESRVIISMPLKSLNQSHLHKKRMDIFIHRHQILFQHFIKNKS